MQTIKFHPSHRYEQALDRAADLWGIERQYGDTWGKVHVTPGEVKRGILSALGVACGSKEELDHAVIERLRNEWERLLPPVVVLGEKSRQNGIPVHFPEPLECDTLSVEIQWEDGGSEARQFTAADLPTRARAEIGGQVYLTKSVPLPAHAPLGYHDVQARLGQRGGATRLILCPDRAYEPEEIRGGKAAGLAIALYGLRSARNWGCGDFTDLDAMLGWMLEDVDAAFIGLNPLHAIPNRQPFNISPYLPTSIFFKNLIYLDIERLEDFRNSRRAQRTFARPEFQAELDGLRGACYIEYERVCAAKTAMLKLAFSGFLSEWRRDTPRARQFREFLAREGGLLERFALWQALDDWIHKRHPDVWVWPQWPEEYREPDSAATHAFAKKHWRLVMFYQYVQWQLELQLAAAQAEARRRGMSIGLYHDLALATDQFGADLWAHRPFYVSGCRVGAPPDGFSPKGQDWAFPPPDTERHREDGYRLFTESVRQNIRHGGALRIDHVMRFFRLYWIPEGMDPTRGAYVRDHHEELLHILALESVRNKVAIVGEDLGTVTPEIRQALHDFGLFGYRVPYFEKTENGEFKLPREYTVQALVSSSTHDLPTLAGFWTGRDIEARRQAGLLKDEAGYRHAWAERTREKQKMLDLLFALGLMPDWYPRRAEHIHELTGELHNAFTGWIALAPSRLMVLNQEDLFKELDQQNLPATDASQYPNWCHKMRFAVEQLRTDPLARSFTAMFRSWLDRTGRRNLAPVVSTTRQNGD